MKTIGKMKREILIEWDHKSLEHIYRHSISEQEVEKAVNGRILIRSTTRKAEKLLRYEKRKVILIEMGKVKIETMADLESLPEEEWVEVPEGLHAKFVYSVDRVNSKLTITLPEEVAKKIGKRLCASFEDEKIVIREIKG